MPRFSSIISKMGSSCAEVSGSNGSFTVSGSHAYAEDGTDPITVTGPLTNSEVAVRSSAGVYLFVPHGYDERIIAQCKLQLLVCEDTTANMAKVAEARHAVRASRSAALREIEGDQTYESQQHFLAVAACVAREGRLSRFVYVSVKQS